METVILVAGGTGDLGERIIKALINRGAVVRALVRSSSDKGKVGELTGLGVQIVETDMTNPAELTKACEGVACVVSALAGLHDVIVDTQSALLRAAVSAGVPRFIPSDFSSDFTKLPAGENRNFDLRREFHTQLDNAAIAPTSILIGAFADILFYNTPLFNLKDNSVGYWGDNADWKIDFTTKDNTAEFTAAAALDSATPRILRVASFQISPNELVTLGSAAKKTAFRLMPMGSLESLSAYNKRERAANPAGENELYPQWQSSQYMHSMFSVQNVPLDNDRYPGIKWTSAPAILAAI